MSFSIEVPAADAVRLTLSDFTRGPGQDVFLPADSEGGVPLSISEGLGVRSAQLRVNFDPARLAIHSATLGAGMPSGSALTIDNSSPGTATIELTSPTDFQAGDQIIAYLQATVPTENATEIYGMQQIVWLSDVVISDGSGNSLPAILDNALHFVSYFGDVSGNGRINAADASRVARFAALIDVPEIPPLPAGVRVSGRFDVGPGLPGVRTHVAPRHVHRQSTHAAQPAAAPRLLLLPTTSLSTPVVDEFMSTLSNRDDSDDEESLLSFVENSDELFAGLTLEFLQSPRSV